MWVVVFIRLLPEETTKQRYLVNILLLFKQTEIKLHSRVKSNGWGSN